jgi:hypothetical protein
MTCPAHYAAGEAADWQAAERKAMPDDGGPDVMVYSHKAMFGEQHKGQYEIKFTPAFWHRLYAGMAMQGMLSGGWEDPPSTIAVLAWAQADILLLEGKRTEDGHDGDGDTPV